jgi:diguanylate cyclase (GGDEF)-like protein
MSRKAVSVTSVPRTLPGRKDTSRRLRADTWTGVQRLVCLWLGPLGAASCLIALLSEPYGDPYYQVALSALATLLSVLTLALLFQRLSVPTVMRTAFVAYAMCLLLGLNDDFNWRVPHDQVIGAGLYWVAVLYAMAFVTFPSQQAVQACRVIFGAAALICLVRLGVLAAQGLLTTTILASVTQYLMFNGVLMLAQFAVGRLRQQLDQARAVAYIDDLTGLPNRRYAQRQLDALIAVNEPFCVVTLDIDHFKEVNDTFGHEIGDRVLRKTGELIGHSLSGEQFMARWGGEEFVLVLPGVSKLEGRTLAETARRHLAQHLFGRAGRLTASFGVAEWVGGDDLEAVMRRADSALYAAKRQGRNRVRVAMDDGRLTRLDTNATATFLDVGLPFQDEDSPGQDHTNADHPDLGNSDLGHAEHGRLSASGGVKSR